MSEYRIIIDRLMVIIGAGCCLFSLSSTDGQFLDDKYDTIASIERAKINMMSDMKMLAFFMCLTVSYQLLIAAEHPKKLRDIAYLVIFMGFLLMPLAKFNLSYIGLFIAVSGLATLLISERRPIV
jgi:hypothetical protein